MQTQRALKAVLFFCQNPITPTLTLFLADISRVPSILRILRVGVAGQKDLYQYWKDPITQFLLQDVGAIAREDRGNMQDKKDSPADNFLVVNVASQEVTS